MTAAFISESPVLSVISDAKGMLDATALNEYRHWGGGCGQMF